MAESIGIVGAGALGTLLATRLAASREVHVVARSSERARAIARDVPAARVHDRIEGLQGAGIIFVCVKAYDTAAAAADLERAGPAPAIVCSLQNGLGNVEALEARLPATPLVVGATWLGAYLDDAGALHASTAGGTQVAPWGVTEPRCADMVAAALSGAGLETEAVGDARRALWTKLVLNAAINPLPAIADRPNGILLEQPALWRVAEAVALEAARVGARIGALPGDFDPRPLLRKLVEATRENRGSMTEDLNRGRRTEADAILGAVARAARDVGEPTPVLEGVWTLVQDAETRRRARISP